MWISSKSKSSVSAALWRELPAIVWVHKKLVLILFAVIIAVGGALLWRVIPLYESSIRILIVPEEEQHNALTETGTVLTNNKEINSELEILRSKENIAAAITDLTRESNSSAELSLPEIAAQLTASVVENSNIIQVTYRAPSPQQAALFLNLLFQKYSEQRQQLRQQEAVATTLRARSATFNRQSEQATASLKNLDTVAGIIPATDSEDLLRKEFYDLQKQAEATRTEKREVEQQLITLKTQLATQPEQLEIGSVTKYVQALDKMKEELIALEMQRTQLLQKYQPNHRLVRDVDQRIAQVKELMAREEMNPPHERSFALNETRRRLTNDLFSAETNLAALTQRERRLDSLVTKQQAQLSTMNIQSAKKSVLERTRAMNEEAFSLYQKKAQEAEINHLLHQAQGLQVRLAEAATINPRPVSPNWSRNLMALIFFGWLFSLAVAVMVESLHPRVRHQAGLQRRFGWEVLAILPTAVATLQNGKRGL